MRLTFVGAAILLLSSVLSASAQTCPAGMPASPWPGPAFVPTADCQGWVPRNHPLAAPIAAAPTGIIPSLVAQDIYTGIEGMPATISLSATGGIKSVQGFAVDCHLGNFPPLVLVTERKPDGSTRTIPNDWHSDFATPRPDVQNAVGAACPAVYNIPLGDGGTLGPFNGFGWKYPLQSPITELGTHTFTVTAMWPAQNHSGASSVTVTIVP